MRKLELGLMGIEAEKTCYGPKHGNPLLLLLLFLGAHHGRNHELNSLMFFHLSQPAKTCFQKTIYYCIPYKSVLEIRCFQGN